jgi:hypothetical protein
VSRFSLENSSAPTRRQSSVGIAALVVGGLSLVSWLGIIGISIAAYRTFKDVPEQSPINIALGVWMVLTIAMTILAVVLGLGAMLKRTSKRSAGVLGGALGLGVMLLLGAVWIVGLSINDKPLFAENDPDRPSAARLATGGAVVLLCGVGVIGLLARRATSEETPQAEHRGADSASGSQLNPALLHVCGTCRKKLPISARFCRRCGSQVG